MIHKFQLIYYKTSLLRQQSSTQSLISHEYKEIEQGAKDSCHNQNQLDNLNQINKREDDQLEQQKQSIKNAKQQIFQFNYKYDGQIGGILNNLIYVATVKIQLKKWELHLWNCQNNKLTKLNKFNYHISFTEDSKLFYVGTNKPSLHQFRLNNLFKQFQMHHFINIKPNGYYRNILCISQFQPIALMEIRHIMKQQLQITISALTQQLVEVMNNYQIIACKSWIVDDRKVIYKKCQYSLICSSQIKANQLMRQDSFYQVIIWNLNFKTQQLQQQKLINKKIDRKKNIINFTSIIYYDQDQYINIYSTDGLLIKQFYNKYLDHNLQKFKIIETDNMKVIIRGKIFIVSLLNLSYFRIEQN
ncbi:hypothetical protein pb186bvf_014174 [Paramecium bursaria]